MRGLPRLLVWISAVVLFASALASHPLQGPSDPAGSADTRVASDAGPGYAVAGPLLAPGTEIRLEFALAPSDPSGLSELDRALVDPASPLQGKYLTEAEFESRFGPDPAAIAQLRSFLTLHGGSDFALAPDRLALSFTLPAGNLTATLGTSLVALGGPGAERLYRADGPPVLPSIFAKLVDGIDGLTDVAASGASLDAALVRPGPGQFVIDGGSDREILEGSDLAQAYGDATLFPGGGSSLGTFGNGTAVATLLTSGFNYTADSNVAPFDPAAVRQYFASTFPPWWPLPSVSGVAVAVDGVSAPPPGPASPFTDDTTAVSENSLDLEMAGSMAPGTSLVNFYFPESALMAPASVGYGDIADDFALDLSAALSHDYAPAHLVAVSSSFGLPDLNDTLWDSELAHAAALGVTVLAATGDEGNAPSALTGRLPGQPPEWPSTAAFDTTGVLAVGGTDLNLSGLPTSVVYPPSPPALSYDTSIGGPASEVAWTSTLGEGRYSGSEGGVSAVYPEPAWQFDSAAQPAVVNATEIEGGSQLGRAVPDVAFAAEGVVAQTASGPGGATLAVYDGTSVAAPLAAGALAECAAVLGHSFGYLDPTLYRLGSFAAVHPP
ncbi:MAG: S53 family peptidase, partial [Thermoplasmata archaeon]